MKKLIAGLGIAALVACGVCGCNSDEKRKESYLEELSQFRKAETKRLTYIEMGNPFEGDNLNVYECSVLRDYSLVSGPSTHADGVFFLRSSIVHDPESDYRLSAGDVTITELKSKSYEIWSITIGKDQIYNYSGHCHEWCSRDEENRKTCDTILKFGKKAMSEARGRCFDE